jgi:glycosyltransferase involved in cell wall biosynthesis
VSASIRLVHVTTVPMSLTFLRGQIGHMKRRGFEVIAVSSPGDELERFGVEQAIDVVGVPMPRAITPLLDLRALASLTRVLRRLRPTIVHAHTPKGGLLGMLAASLARIPVRVYHMRGLPMVTAEGTKRTLLEWSERTTCHAAHKVLAVSASLREIAVAEKLCPADKISILAGGSGNGVDAEHRFNPQRVGSQARNKVRERYGIPADAIVIGFVGRLVRDKGIVELVDAALELTQVDPRVHLLLVGMVEERDAIPPEILARVRIDPRIHWLGPDWNTPPLYAAMDIVALPTYREGFPNVPLEASAMGLPIVATDIPGCRDAVAHEETGILVPPRDANALRDALRRYVVDGQQRTRHGAAGRQRVLASFRQEAIWTALEDVYGTLLARSAL